jgi:leucyl aminopeptidase (aminopeptidase T)
MQERLSEGGGYKQDANGQWVPKSDKRSQYDSQGESPYFKGKVEKEAYKTGEYAKKSWWGSKEYGTKNYRGENEASRYQNSEARQNGMASRDNGKAARSTEPFKTNTLDSKSARESSNAAVKRSSNAYTEAQRSTYKAPSVIDWREQRSMSMDRSRGLLGR